MRALLFVLTTAGMLLSSAAGVGETLAEAAPSDDDAVAEPQNNAAPTAGCGTPLWPYDPNLARQLADDARRNGDALRGREVFRSPKASCLSCHKIGDSGGSVGPPLTQIGDTRTAEQLAESILWPGRLVAPEYDAFLLLTGEGAAHQGYKRNDGGQAVRLFDVTVQQELEIPHNEIELVQRIGSLMPENLAAILTPTQRRDVVRFLMDVASHPELVTMDGRREDVSFEYSRLPLEPNRWPSWQHHVNRDRCYDFYEKEAAHFSLAANRARLLPAFPGLDGGSFGHWGNQSDRDWKDDRWNHVDLGSLMAGVFFGPNGVVPKGVCVRLGEAGDLAACFNPETLRYEAMWRGEFLKFSDVRHGFLDGLRPAGATLPPPAQAPPSQPWTYRGFYRFGKRVIFAYQSGNTEFWDAPWVEDGQFVRVVAPAGQHPLRTLYLTEPPQWPERFRATGRLGSDTPYAIDDVPLPTQNPWQAPIFCGDHAFRSDGTALVCTMHGDVWSVAGLDEKLDQVTWRRFASGLHQPLGIVVERDEVFVLGRDQITRLHDLNGDGEADFYECFSNAMHTSPSGHDFICGLARDGQGRFYTASSSQGVIRVSADGSEVDVLATGLRNPDGIHLAPDGAITVPASEGEWTAASMICRIPAGKDGSSQTPPHFGYGGPRDRQPPSLPLVYLPRGLDNSSGAQVTVPDDRWGPLRGKMIHLSYGAARHFLLLEDNGSGQAQGAVVPLPGEFRSGVHRAHFNPRDGQLYVSGMAGWGTYSTDDGCFQRVRYAGGPVQLPCEFHIHQNGVVVRFTEPVDRQITSEHRRHFAQAWNYRYGQGYGSPEYSVAEPGQIGHDRWEVTAAQVVGDHTVFFEIPDLQSASVLHMALRIDHGPPQQLFITVHSLDGPFMQWPNYRPVIKSIAQHPMTRDLASLNTAPPNPWSAAIAGAQAIEVQTGNNLTFIPRTLNARPGAAIRLIFKNSDVVPHNWALLKQGRLAAVGEMANRLVAAPDGGDRQYIPDTSDVLAYTNVVNAGETFTIFFHAPQQPGRYPFLCTFPGHWMVMNGELIVE
ncbi:MAG: c-type cytochrome [Pirellulales bacterium]|nr:c-type cytochrome [Pirellulales bacterium]